jgi:3-oxoacyl-[acyl-carrier-protein] synthase-3
MALIKIQNVKIKGVAACVPSKVEENSDYPYFDENELDRIMPTIGVERRRVLDEGQTCGDLARVAAEKLIQELGWNKDSIDLLVFCSPDRDYIQPDTSYVIHGKMGLPKSTMTFDMSLGCTGWVYALTTVGALLQTGSLKRAILLNGSMGNALSAFTDKTSYPLLGDCGTATAIEYNLGATPICVELGSDGTGWNDLIIPDGGRRNPVTAESLKLVEYDKNISRSKLHLHMKGMEVFSFGLDMAPKSMNSILEFSGKTVDDMDWFFIHQANYYMVKKIIKKMKIDPSKAPFSMIDFGNTGNCSIPLVMVTKGCESLSKHKANICACAFGTGLSWASACIETEKLVVPELIEYNS